MQRRRSGAFRCFPGSSRGRIQGLLAHHYPVLWGEISVKWLPTARPIAPSRKEATGDYARGTLSDVLIGLGEAGREWDGFEVCSTLQECYGWPCDFHLAAIIHAWSRGVAEKLFAGVSPAPRAAGRQRRGENSGQIPGRQQPATGRT